MRIELPPDPTSAAVARDAVREACQGTVLDVYSVMLCTSELVTNALLHGRPPIELEVDVADSSVRVAVLDADPNLVDRRRPVTAETLSGRGLEIVAATATSWGCEPTPGGKVSWFRIDAAR